MGLIHNISHGQKMFTTLSAAESGITFENTLPETPEANIITYEYFYNGGGVAAGDFNNDGLVDIYFTANLAENKLFLNLGNFKFKDITKSSGAGGKKGWKTGVSVADVNGDGFLDIYVCYSGDVDPQHRHNQLFINNGNLTFTDKAAPMGVDDSGHTTHAVFFDMDRDGDLDLYVLNHNIKNLRNFDAAFVKKMVDPDAGDRLYENVNGKFVNITQKAGIISNPLGYGLGVNIADINNDGWPDIYVTNDYVEEDYLYLNNQNGTFKECLKEQISHISNFSMGVDIADINNDGWQDIFTLDMLPEDNIRQKLLYAPDNYELYNNMVQNGFHHQLMRNMLQINNGNGSFSEIGQVAGVSNTDWSWSALFADFNNDGLKDLYVTNGYGRDMINRDFMKFYASERLKHLQGKTDNKMFKMLQTIRSTPLRNYIYENTGNYTFKDRSVDWGFEKPDFSHGAIYADLDNDGDLDIVDNKMNAPAGVYRNNCIEQKNGNQFLKIALSASDKNTLAIGARVTIFTPSGILMQEHYPVHGFQSSMAVPLHFGLKSDIIDSITVRWPDGNVQSLYDLKGQINTTIVVKKIGGRLEKMGQKSMDPVFKTDETAILYTHGEVAKNDFKLQPLIPDMISYNGPKMAIGDTNKDKLQDIYFCGSAGKAGVMMIQKADGTFAAISQPDFNTDARYEDTDATLFDADSDGDLDLYVVSGGFYGGPSDELLQDRFYLNAGGTFFAKPGRIPKENHSGSVVIPLDFDGDGDLDVFVGGRVVPSKYPLSPGSLLLVNDGKGSFTDGTQQYAPAFKELGMVTDAKWEDINKDGKKELIVSGDWMRLEVFVVGNNTFKKVTEQYFDKSYQGWWKTITLADIDKDGDLDIIAGNWGHNAQFKPSESEPMELYYDDFDKNGYLDPILSYYIQGKSHPMASRDEMTDQIVGLRQRFVTYDAYSKASLEDIFSKEQIEKSPKLIANHMSTSLFLNEGGKFRYVQLPVEANFSPVYSIVCEDFNGDGHLDILLAGNVEQTRVKIGRTDANMGCLLVGDSRGSFKYVPQVQSGLSIKGCVRSLEVMTDGKKERFIVSGINSGKALKISWKK
ncbi:MAG: VCBS repeat-containing protein [Saprospiraceae bacterium]|nr:VCBS repeat-containing protein [Saprospiraceae bacterium]